LFLIITKILLEVAVNTPKSQSVGIFQNNSLLSFLKIPKEYKNKKIPQKITKFLLEVAINTPNRILFELLQIM